MGNGKWKWKWKLEMGRDKQTWLARAGLSSRLDPGGRARDPISVYANTGTLGAVVKLPPWRMVLTAILRHQVTWGATIMISPSDWSDAGRGRVKDPRKETAY